MNAKNKTVIEHILNKSQIEKELVALLHLYQKIGVGVPSHQGQFLKLEDLCTCKEAWEPRNMKHTLGPRAGHT